MNQFDQFWDRAKRYAPGMLDLGIGAYGALAGGKEANRKVDAAQGPLYQTANAQAQQFLGRSTDPRAAARERLNMEMGLLRDEDAQSEAKFRSGLQARGMLDTTSYDVEGKAMDPKLYAFMKAREMRNARMASDALDKGEAGVTANINRAGALQGTANNAQNTGLRGQNARGSNTARNLEFLKSGVGILKDTGMLNTGLDWLRNQFGGNNHGWNSFDFGAGDSSFFGE